MKKVRILYLCLVLFIFSSVFAFAQSEDILKIHFINVGEGDAIFIEAPNNETVLVDTGNLITGFRVVEYLKKNNIQKLDYIIFTHHDLDHIGGAFFVLQMMDVKQIYDNGDDLTQIAKSSNVYRWYEELVRGEENYSVLKTKDSLSLGEVTLGVLWPPQPLPFSNPNPNSLVIMVKYGEFRCLLTGDLTIQGERELLKQNIDLKADVLKVGHHGANDASSEEFLKAVLPNLAVISVSKRYYYNYASEYVLERLRILGAQVYRTDKNGDILLTAKPNGQFKIETEKR